MSPFFLLLWHYVNVLSHVKVRVLFELQCLSHSYCKKVLQEALLSEHKQELLGLCLSDWLKMRPHSLKCNTQVVVVPTVGRNFEKFKYLVKLLGFIADAIPDFGVHDYSSNENSKNYRT